MSSRQEFVSEQPLTHNPTPDAEMTASHKKKSRGKGAKAKSTATFVTKSNQKHMAQQREAALKRLGVFKQGVGPLLQDAIWPADYNVAGLQADVHAYSNLLT